MINALTHWYHTATCWEGMAVFMGLMLVICLGHDLIANGGHLYIPRKK